MVGFGSEPGPGIYLVIGDAVTRYSCVRVGARERPTMVVLPSDSHPTESIPGGNPRPRHLGSPFAAGRDSTGNTPSQCRWNTSSKVLSGEDLRADRRDRLTQSGRERWIALRFVSPDRVNRLAV